MLKRRTLFFLVFALCAIMAHGQNTCPTIELTADKPTVKPDSAVTLKAKVDNGSGYYVWLKNGEEVTEKSPMSLGEFELYYTDDLVSEEPDTVTYKIAITNKQCEVSKEKKIAVIKPSSAKEQTSDTSISVKGRKIMVGGSTSGVKVYNITGTPVSNPVPAAGLYIVAKGNSKYKVLVR